MFIPLKNLEVVWITFFHHSISVTHHLKYPTHLAPSLITHHSIFFTLFVGPIPITWCSIFFFFSLGVKKKKRKPKNPNPVKEEEKKEKKN